MTGPVTQPVKTEAPHQPAPAGVFEQARAAAVADLTEKLKPQWDALQARAAELAAELAEWKALDWAMIYRYPCHDHAPMAGSRKDISLWWRGCGCGQKP